MSANKILTYSFTENYLDNLVDYLNAEYIQKGKDISRLAIVFGGRRPQLFVKKRLAELLKKEFYPPRFFTIDEFIHYTLKKHETFQSANDLDGCFTLYKIAQEVAPQILQGRESFAEFLPWTRKILAFIDQLDLENVDNSKLKNIEANAKIGYDVPEDINRLLESIVAIRKVYHRKLLDEKTYSRGLQYYRAAGAVDSVNFDEFDQIIFCNFFYFNRSEETVVKNLYQRDKATLIFQGDQRKWPVLDRIARNFSCSIVEGKEPDPTAFNLNLAVGAGAHAQVAQVRDVLKKIPAKELPQTVIVLPNADNIIPLLSEITSVTKEFNISMGYPLKRSSLYSLFEFIFKAQLSRKETRYYAKDYLKVLRHPFIKNLLLGSDAAVVRILVHKIEEVLTGKETASVTGSLFVELSDIENSELIYTLSQQMLERMDIAVSRDELQAVLFAIHQAMFVQWEKIQTFKDFAVVLDSIIQLLIHKSFMHNYPLNLNIADKILGIKDEFQSASFASEHFNVADIFRIFESAISHEIVAFIGSPLKGLQILGLFETRSLNFKNVIVLDVNEGVLPRLDIYESLIPRDVMISLNLDRLELEEEIQRYQFMRLISAAENVYLVYQKSKDKEKSRFVEELIWEQEKKKGVLGTVQAKKGCFHVEVGTKERRVRKTPEMVVMLKQHKYSASSLNMYLRNPMDFYYNYVLGLREKEDLLDEPEARHVGTFIHNVLQHGFLPSVNGRPVIDQSFRQKMFEIMDHRFEETFGRSMKSDAFLLKSVIKERLERFLDNELNSPERRVDEILDLERYCEGTITLSNGPVKFGYIVDRIDRMKDGTIMVIDYKTGSADQIPRPAQEIAGMTLSRENIRDTVRSFQLPLYYHFLSQEFKGQPVNAALYNLRTLKIDRFIHSSAQTSSEDIVQAYQKPLDFIISEIINPDVDFVEDLTV